jgi:hypothetical protein
MDLATSLSAPFWKTLAHCLEGKLLIRCGEFGEGSVRLRTALDNRCLRVPERNRYPAFWQKIERSEKTPPTISATISRLRYLALHTAAQGEQWL